jgi:hypothetical protein
VLNPNWKKTSQSKNSGLGFGVLALLVFMSAACTTTGPYNPVTLPSDLSHHFVGCAKGDGALLMRVFQAQELKIRGEVEWLATNESEWQINLMSPLGESMVQIKRVKSALDISGMLSKGIPKVAIREDGYLEIDGHLVALRADELTCFFQNKLPQAWVPFLYRISKKKGSVLRFADEVRNIRLHLIGGRQAPPKMCAKIKWSQMLGLVRSELDLCFTDRDGKQQATLEGLEDFSLSWVSLDE